MKGPSIPEGSALSFALSTGYHNWYMRTWRNIGTSVDGQRFEIDGLNVWAYPWMAKDGKPARVRDPIYRQAFAFPVYESAVEDKRISFAAGEFSNCVWGFYVEAVS